MSNTHKHKANYFRFKEHKPGSEIEIPNEYKDLVKVMDVKYKGYRFGDDRKSSAKSRVHNRRIKRAKMKHGDIHLLNDEIE